jgi:hypothetical protein
LTIFSSEKLKAGEKSSGEGQAHALVIGTGRYPFIENPKPELPFEFRMLKSLETAPASALAMADWLLDGFDPPNVTQCTVELLVNDPRNPSGDVRYAPPGSSNDPVAVEHPTISNVKEAFGRWKKRCDTSPNNMAIFYVCGHGFWLGSVLALLEDTGASEVRDWFEAAISFDIFVQNMVQCKAGVQIFLADCCQELAPSARQYVGMMPGDPLIPVFTPVNPKRNGLVVKAAQPGLSAHAPPGYEPAYVTQAILAALKGRAAEPGPNGWRITCGKMGEAIEQVLMEFDDTDVRYFKPEPIGLLRTELHRLSESPDVPVQIQFNPTRAIHEAEVSLSSSDGKVLFRDQSVPDDAWSPGSVRPGMYYAEAHFATSAFRNAKAEVYALPPIGKGWLITEP